MPLATLFALCATAPVHREVDDAKILDFLNRQGFVASNSFPVDSGRRRSGWFRHRATGYEGLWTAPAERPESLVSLSIFQSYPKPVSRDVLRNGLTIKQKDSMIYCEATWNGRVWIYAGELGEFEIPDQVMDWKRATDLARSFARVAGGKSRSMTSAERGGIVGNDLPSASTRVTSLTIDEVRGISHEQRWVSEEEVSPYRSNFIFLLGRSPNILIEAYDEPLGQVFAPGYERRFRMESRRVGVLAQLGTAYPKYAERELGGWELTRSTKQLLATKWISLADGPTVGEISRQAKVAIREAREVWNVVGSPK